MSGITPGLRFRSVRLALPRSHVFQLSDGPVTRLAVPAPQPVVIPAVHGVVKGLVKSLVKASPHFR